MGLDPEIAAVPMAQAKATADTDASRPQRGDAHALRPLINQALEALHGQLPPTPNVTSRLHTLLAHDGSQIEARWYERSRRVPGPAIVYVHGGGGISGTLDNYDGLVRHYGQLTGVPILAVGYRLAPEFPGETSARDSFAGLVWMVQHAAELGVDPGRIAVMGDSGGGGVGAGAAILARDNGVPLSKQILIFPMLDDRNTEPDPLLAPTAIWTYDDNYTAWHARLGDRLGAPDVSPVAAPARLANYAGLSTGYIEVGEFDIFRDESIRYAQHMFHAGVSCELHVHPGASHLHDWINPNAALSKRVMADRVRVIRSL